MLRIRPRVSGHQFCITSNSSRSLSKNKSRAEASIIVDVIRHTVTEFNATFSCLRSHRMEPPPTSSYLWWTISLKSCSCLTAARNIVIFAPHPRSTIHVNLCLIVHLRKPFTKNTTTCYSLSIRLSVGLLTLNGKVVKVQYSLSLNIHTLREI